MDFFGTCLRVLKTKVGERKDGPIFYHYTNRLAAEIIAQEGIIRSQGNGILLNVMRPDLYYRSEILMNNYGTEIPNFLRNRADYCVRVLPTKLDAKKLRKDELPSGRLIYLYDGEIHVKALDVFDKPMCTRSVATNGLSVEHPTVEVQQPSSSSTTIQSRIRASCDVKDESAVSPPKIRRITEIKIDLRCDIKLDHRYSHEHQDGNVTIFAFEWIKEGLKCLRESFDDEIVLNVAGSMDRRIKTANLSLKDVQILSRNESSNTNGLINFAHFGGISKEVIYSLKDLNRQTVIVGKDHTTHYGGYPRENRRVPQRHLVYVCDLIGLQFQQQYNTGRLVLVGENLPRGLLDEFIYEQVVKEKKPTMDTVRSDHTGRFFECSGVFFDSRAYVKFVANDVLLTGMALNQCATEPLNFKFLMYGTGFYAGPFRNLLERFIGQGVAEGLDNLLRNLPPNHLINAVELPYFDPYQPIDSVCSKHNIEVKYSKDDALKTTRFGCVTATTNTADAHCVAGNKMGFGSVDGAIAENLNGKAIKFSPISNGMMRESFV